MTEEEESFIQSFICDELEEAPSHQYSSRKDPYTSIAYTNLDEEVKLVDEPKSIAYIGQLVLLVGEKCRVAGCEEGIEVSVHTNCGYGVKLSWICKKKHRYFFIVVYTHL